MEQTKIRLMLDYPFFGSLALTMQLIEDSSIQTVTTNGKEVRYNQDFIAGLSSANKLFIYIHEICHVILGHSVRRGNRKPEPWNIACDYAANLLIHESTNVVRPPWALFSRDYEGWSAERIYEELADKYTDQIQRSVDQRDDGEELTPAEQSQQEAYDGLAEASAESGTVEDSAPEDNVTEEELHSSAALITRILTATGTPPPPAIRTLVATFVDTKIRWQDLLSRFMSETCANKYDWMIPNRRYQGSGGVILPSLSTNDSLTIAVVIDTSGSVDINLLSEFVSEFKILISSIPYNKVIVMSCSDYVHGPKVFTKGEDINFVPQGSGSTAFAPAFEYIANMDENPSCVIYFTDLFSDTFGQSPGCPVLWIGKYSERWEKSHLDRIPFGEIINME